MNVSRRFFNLTGLCLWTAAVFGAICILPYALALAPASLEAAAEQSGLPMPALLAASVIQSALLLGLMTFTGLWAAGKLGLGAPLVDAVIERRALPTDLHQVAGVSILLGVASASLVLGLDLFVFGAPLESAEGAQAALNIAPWKAFLASFYGGIAEEIQLRLFFLSLVALGIRYVARRVAGGHAQDTLSSAVFWTANIIAAVLFGLGHLPATAEFVPLTPLIITRAILLNGLVGVVAGTLFWRRGIEMAMVCHFSADIVLHVVFPLVK